MKPNLIGKTREELTEAVQALGHPAFRAKQLWHWLYWQGVTDFDAMTNLSKAFRADLANAYDIRRPQVTQALHSSDGTAKWLLAYADGQETETVHIPESDRGTLCVSSQVGCTLTCKILPHRDPAAGAQSDHRGNFRPIYAGARCLWRMAHALRGNASHIQCCSDGYGRALI